jgi:hypothetical protein
METDLLPLLIFIQLFTKIRLDDSRVQSFNISKKILALVYLRQMWLGKDIFTLVSAMYKCKTD